MTVVRLAILSLLNRWPTAILTVLAIAFSVTLLIGVEKVRNGARASFANTISGTDLVVGARTGGIQLLLYSVFRIGNATNNLTWQSYQDIAKRPEVAWIVPISLGDSHRGFRVMGTSTDYFKRYRYRRKQPLAFTKGRPFDDLFDAVVGADVAQTLGYKVSEKIVIAHGIGAYTAAQHDDKPFRVVGILAKTGTPVDRTVHVSLEAIEAIHIDWEGGRRKRANAVSAEQVRKYRLRPRAVTAALIGLKSKIATFRLQRYINTYPQEPLLAILPGVALHELWALIGTAETALTAISIMVVITALLGMATMILATLNERRREIAILRSVGAGPRTVLAMLVSEAAILTLLGVIAGVILVYSLLFALRPKIDAMYGLYLDINLPSLAEWATLGVIILAGCIVSLLPAIRAYRMSLAEGMTVKS